MCNKGRYAQELIDIKEMIWLSVNDLCLDTGFGIFYLKYTDGEILSPMNDLFFLKNNKR
jgi:hypothetical protein